MGNEYRTMKEPWLAVCLSWLVPGVGQCYAGAWISGLLFLGGWFGLQSLATWQAGSAQGHLLVAVPLVLGGLVLWFIGLFHAYYAGRKTNSSDAEQERRQARDPFFALFLTLIVPGSGHFYLKRWLGGVLLLIGALVLWTGHAALCGLGSSIAGLLLGAVVLSTYEAGAALLAYRAGRPERRRSPAGIVGVCLLGLGIGTLPMASAIVVREYAVEAFRISGGSMAPTLQPGDRILVWKERYEPERGDVIAYRNPLNPDVTYVHRVAALAGEMVEVRTDGVYVGGNRLTEKPFDRLREIPAAPHPPGRQTWAHEGKPFTVPHGHVFVVGDKINRSFDSRYLGPVPLEAVVGEVYKRYWPLSREGPIE